MNKKTTRKEKPLTKEGFFRALNKVVLGKPPKKRGGKRSASKRKGTSA